MDFVWYINAYFPPSVLDSSARATSQWTKFLKFCFVALFLVFGWALWILVLARRWRCPWAIVALATCQRAQLLDSSLLALILPLFCAFRMLIFAFRCRWFW